LRHHEQVPAGIREADREEPGVAFTVKIEDEIIAEAQRLFDAAGIASYGKDSILILGMVTSPERDLDDFLRNEKGEFKIGGFEIHAKPGLFSLVSFIREKGLSAEILGWCGYPSGEELNLKQQAVAAGLGSWGKSTMLLHPRFGPWLRLMSVRVVGSILSATGPGKDNHSENPLCRDCTACIDACPLGILEPYYLRDSNSCLAHTSRFPQPGKIVCCDQCWTVCPVGK